MEKVFYYVNEDKRAVTCVIYPDAFRLKDFIHRKSEDVFWLGHDYFPARPSKYVGVAKCHPDDEFNVEVGKKLAFMRARDKCDKAFFADLQNAINFIDNHLEQLIDASNRYGMKLSRMKDQRREEIATLTHDVF